MIWWILGLAVLTILSYLSDMGIIALQNVRVPFLNASVLSLLILLVTAGLLFRMLSMRKKGRKEQLEKKIHELEEKLSSLGAGK